MSLLFDTFVQKMKYNVLREVAKLAYNDELTPQRIMDISTKIIPEGKPMFRCCIYKERAIINQRVAMALGGDEDGNVVLGDEMLTPDSSRFWPLEGYEAGHGQPSFDKQFVRDWLKANPDSNYDLPQDVIDKTIAKYLEAYELLTGKKL